MAFKYYLGVVDYTCVLLALLISAGIGVKFRFTGNRQITTKDYLMAGQNMSKFPVILSISVTMISAVSMLGSPSETYRYGLQPIIMPLAMPIGIALAAYVFIPVYFRCGISTVYEFLEIRFGKVTRYIVSSLFILQVVYYMSSVLYAPVLALSAVTDLSIELSIIVFGTICAFYCSMGGLKAVLWTDVFQTFLMFIAMATLYVAGIMDAGGIANIYSRGSTGKRLNIFNFQMDLTTRYTFWNCFIQGIMHGFLGYGTNQLEVQRLLSLSSEKRAKSTLLISILPATGLFVLCNMFGIILYAVYYLCDPISNSKETGLSKYDQLVPHFLVSKLHSIPGLTGLCIAGIFSGSLSTISSGLNSLSTVTVMDIIKPLVSSTRLSDSKVVYLAKVLSLVYGFICICFAFALSNTGSVKQVANLISVMDGPIAAVFTIGVLTTKGSGKNVLFGLLAGFVLASWIGYGSLFSGYIQPTLPMSTSMCALPFNSSDATPYVSPIYQVIANYSSTVPSTIESQSETFTWQKISYLWIRPLGFISTLFFVLISTLVTGWKTADANNSLDMKYLSPVTRLWMKNVDPKQCKGSINGLVLEVQPSFISDISMNRNE